MSEWYVDNNGTGETVSIYSDDRLVADVYEIEDAARIVADHNSALAASSPDAGGDAARLRALEDVEQKARALIVAWVTSYPMELAAIDDLQSALERAEQARAALAAEPRPEGGETEQSCTVEGCTVPPGMLH